MSAEVQAAVTDEVLLEGRGLNVAYGKIEVLHSVDIEVRRGEIVSLLGANGAGKTTLLRALVGQLRPSAGSVELLGQPCRSSPHRRARQGLAYLGDDRHVFPSLTVRQNLRLVSRRERPTGLFPELEPLMGSKAGLLSGGEQQMLGLARALADEPKVLLVDELSLGLAPLVRDSLIQRLRVVADSGAAVLVVEQSAGAILAAADRAYVLRRGEVVDTRDAREWEGKSDELMALYLL
jgi:branched-chain amino acid transport system ATP-binding protein